MKTKLAVILAISAFILSCCDGLFGTSGTEDNPLVGTWMVEFMGLSYITFAEDLSFREDSSDPWTGEWEHSLGTYSYDDSYVSIVLSGETTEMTYTIGRDVLTLTETEGLGIPIVYRRADLPSSWK